MFADVRHLRYHPQRLVAHVLRVRSGESYSHVGSRFRHFSKQRREVYGAAEVRVHVLSQQGHLFKSPFVQVAHLSQYAIHVTASLPSSGIRHYAVVAEVVASSHDANKPAYFCSVQSLRHNILIRLRSREFNVYGLVSGFRLSDEVRQGKISVRSRHEVSVVVLQQVFLHPFRHTPEHPDYKFMSLFPFRIQSVESVIYFLFRIISYGASVEKHRVSHVEVVASLVSSHEHNRSHNLRVSHIHLASVSFDI